MASKQIRPIRVEGNVAYVPLTKGYTAIIDAADVPLVEGRNWATAVQDHTVYAQAPVHGVRGKSYLMHRLLMGLPRGAQVDHVDGNGLNNRRSNLRLATASQNQHNKGVQRNNTSGFKGVRWVTGKGKWVARIDKDGRRKHLGYFDTPEAAHAAYVAASTALHGEFSRTA